MADVTFSIITPTQGREGTVDSVLNTLSQMGPDDELLLVSDGKMPATLRSQLPPRVTVIETPRTRFWGNFQRDVGLCVASRTHVLYVDDDDKLDNLEAIRALVADRPDLPHLFNLDGAGITWPWLGQKFDHIVGACWVLPNDKSKLRLWEFILDFPHLANNLAEYDGNCIKHPDVTMVHMRVYSREPFDEARPQ